MNVGKGFRLAVGFVVAPITPGLIFAVADALHTNSVGAGWFLMLSAAVGYPAAIILGVPAHFILRRRQMLNWRSYAVAGALIGGIAYGVIFAKGMIGSAPSTWHTLSTALVFFPVTALCGTIAVSIFWLVVRPDTP